MWLPAGTVSEIRLEQHQSRPHLWNVILVASYIRYHMTNALNLNKALDFALLLEDELRESGRL